MSNTQSVRVGLGVIIENENGHILIGKRTGSHAPYYSIPGGLLDIGESFVAGAIREVQEETDLTISNPEVITITNNLKTYQQEGKHHISIILWSNSFSGELIIKEPTKCESWLWANPQDLPRPHFEASEAGVACWLQNTVTPNQQS